MSPTDLKNAAYAFVAVVVLGALLIAIPGGIWMLLTSEERRREQEMTRSDAVRMLLAGICFAAAGSFFLYSVWQKGPQQDTSAVRNQGGQAQPAEKADQGPKHTPEEDVPITIKDTTCSLKAARTSESKLSTAESAELMVTLSVPANARECHDTVTVDAPNFGMGKRNTQSVSITRPEESYVAHWQLAPTETGTWNIAVETKKDREVVPVAVTTALGFPARWAEAGAFLVAAAGVMFAVINLFKRGS